MNRAMNEPAVITMVIGIAEGLFNKPIAKDDNAPAPNCIAPISEEAVPAFSEKGASDNASRFGISITIKDKKRKSFTMVSY